MELSRNQMIVLALVLAVIGVLAVAVGVLSLKSPVGKEMGEIHEPPLPDDIGEAQGVIRTRYAADIASGMPRADVEKRHQRRLDELKMLQEAQIATGS